MLIMFDFDGWIKSEEGKRIEFNYGSFHATVADENPHEAISWAYISLEYIMDDSKYKVTFDQNENTGVQELFEEDENRKITHIRKGIAFEEGNLGTYGAQGIHLYEGEPSEEMILKVLAVFESLRNFKEFPLGINVRNISFE